MNLFEPINHSQTLLQQLSIAINNNSESELKRILNALANDLEQIKINTSTLQQQLTQLRKNKTNSKLRICPACRASLK